VINLTALKKQSIYLFLNFLDFTLNTSTMNDITDATESARTILLDLNREWMNKQGGFFVESPINFVTAIIWFLKKYADGKYCTFP
jgi:hypothetical protein